MSDLPCELLDHIIDFLYDSQPSLRNCCLVSKSWIPRTRKHFFTEIDFRTGGPGLQLWKKTFPDPLTSPARYAKTLAIGCPKLDTAAGAEAGSWIASFSSVEELRLGGAGWGSHTAPVWELAFILLRAFSPTLKTILIHFSSASLPFPHFFNFVLSFPLLEDLGMIERPGDDVLTDNGGDSSTVVQPLSIPAFTGSLYLRLRRGIGPVARRLLPLQSGIHFQKLSMSWNREEDISLTTVLVERCSRTLESLDIFYDLRGMSISPPRPRG